MDIKNDIHIMEMNDNLYQRLKQSELVIHAKVESILRQIINKSNIIVCLIIE